MAKRITIKDVKHVEFTFDDYITEFADHPEWTIQDIGVLFRIDLQLYRNGGKVENDTNKLARLCRLTDEDFAKTWARIESKYKKNGRFLFRKRIRKELKVSRRRMQKAYDKAVKAAEARYSKHTTSTANENETKSKTNNSITSNSKRQSLSPSNSLRFRENLQQIIKPQSKSDRTAFDNLCRWVIIEINAGHYNTEIYKRILMYADEARKNGRNPAAMFFGTLKRELSYR
jgi:uncharacterized protein YdaU (DUF1376 family)